MTLPMQRAMVPACVLCFSGSMSMPRSARPAVLHAARHLSRRSGVMWNGSTGEAMLLQLLAHTLPNAVLRAVSSAASKHAGGHGAAQAPRNACDDR